MPNSELDLIASGILNHRRATFIVELNGNRRRIRNTTGFTIGYTQNYDSTVLMGDALERYLPAYGAIDGSIKVYPDDGIWLAMIQYIANSSGEYPSVEIRVQLPQDPRGTVPTALLASPHQTALRAAYADLTLSGCIFKNLPMMSGTSTEYSEQVDIGFVASAATIVNNLPGHDILTTGATVATATEDIRNL